MKVRRTPEKSYAPFCQSLRRDGMDDFKKQKKAAEISEDVEAQLEDELQKLTDDFMKKVDGIIEKKTKEIMTV